MAKPAGAVDASDGVIVLGNPVESYVGAIMVDLPVLCPYQQAEFQTSNALDQIEVRAEYIIEAGYTLEVEYYYLLNEVVTDAGAASGFYDLWVRPDQRSPKAPKEYSGNLPNTDRYPQYFGFITRWDVNAALTGDDEVLAIDASFVQDKAEDAGSLALQPTYEVFGADSTGIHLYDAGMPLSAYALMVCTADNLNAMAYTRQAFTTPAWAMP